MAEDPVLSVCPQQENSIIETVERNVRNKRGGVPDTHYRVVVEQCAADVEEGGNKWSERQNDREDGL